MATTVEEICPSVETLLQRQSDASLPCPTQGCCRVFHNRPCLRMHLVKTHGVAANDEEKNLYVRGRGKIEKHFYCPVKHCVRGQGTKRHFPRMSQLKQHYMTVHAEKTNVCGKCGKGFGLADACRRHEVKCGQLFTCLCGCPYTTLEALLTHARRKMHKVPECYKTIKESSKTPVPPTVAFVVVEPSASASLPVQGTLAKISTQCQKTSKHCLILPKLSPVTSFGLNTAAKKVTKSVQTQTPFDVQSMHTQTPRQLINTEQGCDSYTQTPPPNANQQFQFSNNGQNLQIGFNQASVGTQVAMLASQCDFGVGTDESFLAQLGCFNDGAAGQPFEFSSNMSQATQVQRLLPPISSFAPRQNRSSFVSTNESSMQTLAMDPLFLNNQTQTTLHGTHDLRPLSSTQTQTCNLEQVPLEDNETQTLISLLGIDSCSSMDSGTQTQNFLDDLFDTQDIELTESQTQTWFSGLPLTSPGLDNSGNEFVYKTLDDLVDIHTQTSIVMSDFSELAEDTEFASSHTQTLQSDFGSSSFLSSSVQTDTHWAEMTQTNGPFRNGSISTTTTSCQTQTQQNVCGHNYPVSSVETQT